MLQVEALLEMQCDPLLLASIAEELAAQGSEYHNTSVMVLESFVKKVAALPPKPRAEQQHRGAEPRAAESRGLLLSSEYLASATRSLISMRQTAADATDQKNGDGDGSARLAIRGALLGDLKLVARRATSDGVASVCNDPSHLEWLSDSSWYLAYLEGQRMPQGVLDNYRTIASSASSLKPQGCTPFPQAESAPSAPDPLTARQAVTHPTGSLVAATAGETVTEEPAEPSVGDKGAAAISYCAELTEVSCDLTAALPITEVHRSPT